VQAVCALIVIGITGESLAEISKVARQVDQYAQQYMQYMQGMGISNTEGFASGATIKGPETSKLGFLVFVSVVGMFMCRWLHVPAGCHSLLPHCASSRTTAACEQRSPVQQAAAQTVAIAVACNAVVRQVMYSGATTQLCQGRSVASCIV
jgi:hypothetical protein